MQEREYVQAVGKNPLLAYIMLQVIEKYQHDVYVAPEICARIGVTIATDESAQRVLTPQRFYRVLYLIDKHCHKKGLDLKLPCYWYKSGPVIHAAEAPAVYKVARLQKTQHAVASFAAWKETILIFDGFESAYSDAILLTQNARQLGDLSRLDIVYEYSPSHTHKILITLLNELSHFKKHSVLNTRQKKVIQELLERLVFEAWDSKYNDLYPALVDTAKVLNNALDSNVSVGTLSNTITALWDLFALALRAKENSYIDSSTRQRWKDSYQHALADYTLQ